jgi:hypothetical protein
VNANESDLYGDVVRNRHGETPDVPLYELSFVPYVRLSYGAFPLSLKHPVHYPQQGYALVLIEYLREHLQQEYSQMVQQQTH